MYTYNSCADDIVDRVLSDLATQIIKSLSAKTKIDPDTLASFVPGLVHNHWYITDTAVDGCGYCARITECNRGFVSRDDAEGTD